MKVQDLLQELFDTKFDAKVIKRPGFYYAKADVDGEEVEFHAHDTSIRFGSGERISAWDVEFDIGDSAIATGTGNSIRVMSFVQQSIEDFVRTVKPKAIIFTASKNDLNNRTRAYIRMFKRVMPGLTVETQPRDEDYDLTIMRVSK